MNKELGVSKESGEFAGFFFLAALQHSLREMCPMMGYLLFPLQLLPSRKYTHRMYQEP